MVGGLAVETVVIGVVECAGSYGGRDALGVDCELVGVCAGSAEGVGAVVAEGLAGAGEDCQEKQQKSLTHSNYIRRRQIYIIDMPLLPTRKEE